MPLTAVHPPGFSHAIPAPAGKEEIRPLERTDREPIRQLLVATDVFTPAEVDIAFELIDCVLEKPDQKDYVIFTYESGNRVAGYYCIGPTPATDGTFDLYWIAVHPMFQGTGIGRTLDDHAVEYIRSAGGRLIIAETSSQPKYEQTRRFYSSHGYSELSRIRDYYRIGDDLVVYGKYLS